MIVTNHTTGSKMLCHVRLYRVVERLRGGVKREGFVNVRRELARILFTNISTFKY